MPAFLPFLDLRGYSRQDLTSDLTAAVTVTFMSIPQALAYAMIAGLPPAMGLYAACIPAIVGSFFRSSRHVISGPSNAVSLLVGEGLAAHAGLDPVGTALLLALLVGGLQVALGFLRFGALVDYISMPVVMGYITGAGVLIGVGQLPNLLQVEGADGHLVSKLRDLVAHVPDTSALSLGIGLGAVVLIVAVRKLSHRIPGAILALAGGALATWVLELDQLGLLTIADVAEVPRGLPPLTFPDLMQWRVLMPLAVAATVLSLVESSSVARAVSTRTGQHIDADSEFWGQGLANVAAAFTGGYPVSGSLARTTINEQAGARTRASGMYGGMLLLVSLPLLAPIIDYTPVTVLAGLLLVVAYDLIDLPEIRRILRGRFGDSMAFVATLFGTWILPLDQAIYLGVVISVLLFLPRARLLVIRSTEVGDSGMMREIPLEEVETSRTCRAIRVLHVEGQVFFASAGELRRALDEVCKDPAVKVVVVRIKRAHGLDYSAVRVFTETAAQLRSEGRHLFLVGVRERTMEVLERTGAVEAIGKGQIFLTRPRWFEAMNTALARAVEEVGDHPCRETGCPLREYLAQSPVQLEPETGFDTADAEVPVAPDPDHD